MNTAYKWFLNAGLGLVTLLGSMLVAFAGSGGTADGGGDFAYYHSGVRKFQKSASNQLVFDIAQTPQVFFDEVLNPAQVNRERLASILSHVEERLTEDRFRKNPQGDVEPLQLDFGLNNKGEESIFILSGFFDWGVRRLENAGSGFKRAEAEDKLLQDMRLKLFKEALHHFGIINDDRAQDLALYSQQLGANALMQINQCERLQAKHPGFTCFKSWQAGYWKAAQDIENWESDRLTSKIIIFGTDEGLTLEFDLSQKEVIQAYLPKYQIHGQGSCVERRYERTDCTIKKEFKDGHWTSLKGAYRVSLKYEKENGFNLPVQVLKPFRITYSVGGDRDDEVGTHVESTVVLMRSQK